MKSIFLLFLVLCTLNLDVGKPWLLGVAEAQLDDNPAVNKGFLTMGRGTYNGIEPTGLLLTDGFGTTHKIHFTPLLETIERRGGTLTATYTNGRLQVKGVEKLKYFYKQVELGCGSFIYDKTKTDATLIQYLDGKETYFLSDSLPFFHTLPELLRPSLDSTAHYTRLAVEDLVKLSFISEPTAPLSERITHLTRRADSLAYHRYGQPDYVAPRWYHDVRREPDLLRQILGAYLIL